MRALFVVLVCCSSCFVGYDSRWGEAKRSQQTIARHAKPGELEATPDDSAGAQVSVRKLRAYVTADYAAQVSHEQKQIARLIDDANHVLEPTLHLRLELGDVRRFRRLAAAPRDLVQRWRLKRRLSKSGSVRASPRRFRASLGAPFVRIEYLPRLR